MTILESFAQIPLMLYISLILLPVTTYGYLVFAKPKKKVAAAAANPADQLKKKALDVKRESISALFLGATVAFCAGLLVGFGILISDYKNSRNLFAETMPAASFPPVQENVFPPATDGGTK